MSKSESVPEREDWVFIGVNHVRTRKQFEDLRRQGLTPGNSYTMTRVRYNQLRRLKDVAKFLVNLTPKPIYGGVRAAIVYAAWDASSGIIHETKS